MGFAQKLEQVFGRKSMADQKQQPGQPIMVTEEIQPGAQAPIAAATPQDVPVQPAAPVEPQAPSRQDVPDTTDVPTPPADEAGDEDTTQPEQEDRSAFNCTACGGEGLKDGNNQYEVCPVCKGTGKA